MPTDWLDPWAVEAVTEFSESTALWVDLES